MILLKFFTPIIDIDYYLPKFSKFHGDIFRPESNNNEQNIIPITKTTDICLSKLINIENNIYLENNIFFG